MPRCEGIVNLQHYPIKCPESFGLNGIIRCSECRHWTETEQCEKIDTPSIHERLMRELVDVRNWARHNDKPQR